MTLVHLHCHRDIDKALQPVFSHFVQEIDLAISVNNMMTYNKLCEVHRDIIYHFVVMNNNNTVTEPSRVV